MPAEVVLHLLREGLQVSRASKISKYENWANNANVRSAAKVLKMAPFRFVIACNEDQLTYAMVSGKPHPDMMPKPKASTKPVSTIVDTITVERRLADKRKEQAEFAGRLNRMDAIIAAERRRNLAEIAKAKREEDDARFRAIAGDLALTEEQQRERWQHQ